MKILNLPCTKEDLKALKVNDKVLLNGYIYTARDAAHQRLVSTIENGEKLPLDLNNAAIYYVGPTKTPPGQHIGSAGPTTATRMDKYTPSILNEGVNILIGKGKRSVEVKDALKKHQGVYLIAIGGAGAILSNAVVENELIAYEDLDSEAIRKLKVKDFPVFVGIDLDGNDIYEEE